jgi:isopropylmalate/homocitrate/citramalate synthase
MELCKYKQIFNYIYELIGSPKPFDVTLRDGLQSLTKEQQQNFDLKAKTDLYRSISIKYSPKNMEIGSCVSEKILPIFKDTEQLFNYAENYCTSPVTRKNNETNHYILVPNEEKMVTALGYGLRNFSFITSVSDDFQVKNTKMDIKSNLSNIRNMMTYLDDHILTSIKNNLYPDCSLNNIKIYVSCIDECPISGKIPLNKIIKHIIEINELKPTTICLSDTCGTLTNESFKKIITNLRKNDVSLQKLSLHLHVKKTNKGKEEAQKIFNTALDNGIINFDVSALDTGGCSVTMDSNKIAPNLSYDLYYEFLAKYIINKTL